MLRDIFGFLFFLVSGFFVFAVGVLAFFDLHHIGINKSYLLGLFSIPIIVFLSLGLFLYRGVDWRVSTGITVIGGGASCILAVILVLLIKNTSELSLIANTSSLNAFNDYLSGILTMAAFLLLGVILYISGTLGMNDHSEEWTNKMKHVVEP